MNNKISSRLYRIKKNIYSIIDLYAYKLDLKRRTDQANWRVEKRHLEPLSKDEKKEFNKLWRGWSPKSHMFLKAFLGEIDMEIAPNDFYNYAERVLNLRWGAMFTQHKCCLKYFVPKENRPHTILQKMNGHYVLEDNTEISYEEATERLKHAGTFVCKIARGTGGGLGVRKINLAEVDNIDSFLQDLLRPADLIFQDIIQQGEFMKQFNPDSVNTFRIVTLNINQRCSVLSVLLRMGAKGSFVDNVCSGKGAFVGVSQEGVLSPWGATKSFQKVFQAPSGVLFDGIVVPNWENIKNTIISFHKKIPQVNLIGWDITIDKNNKPIVIEVNLDSLEVEALQIFNGPIFGDRLPEVKQYIATRKPQLKHVMITN